MIFILYHYFTMCVQHTMWNLIEQINQIESMQSSNEKGSWWKDNLIDVLIWCFFFVRDIHVSLYVLDSNLSSFA